MTTITTTKYATGSSQYYAIGKVGEKIYTAIESTRQGAFMAVAHQLMVAGIIAQSGKCPDCGSAMDNVYNCCTSTACDYFA